MEQKSTYAPHKLEEVVEATAQLINILSQETEWLRQGKISSIGEVQAVKHECITLLETYHLFLHRHPTHIRTLDHDLLAQLKELGMVLAEVMEENHRELLKAKELNMYVIDFIASAAKEQLLEKSGYNRYGGMGYAQRPTNASSISMPPMSVNNSV